MGDEVSQKRRLPVFACVECRQSKVKCHQDGAQCSRCRRLGIACRREKGFKRLNRSSKIQQLESEIQDLHQHIGSERTPFLAPLPQLDTSPPATGYIRYSSATPVRSSSHDLSRACRTTILAQFQPPLLSQSLDRPSTPIRFSLNDIALEVAQADILFKTFFDKYHRYLPFLDKSLTSSECHKKSSVLFWTIIAIASRQDRSDSPLSCKLYPLLHEMILHTVASPPVRLATIQAMILICNWPTTSVRMTTDISLTFISLAYSAAKALGLHRPGQEREYSLTHDIDLDSNRAQRLRTWIACAVTAQNLIQNHGLEPITTLQDWISTQTCEGKSAADVPIELQRHLMICRLREKICRHLAQGFLDPSGVAPEAERRNFTSSLEAELQVLSNQLRPNISFATALRLQDAETCLYSTNFLPCSNSEAAQAGMLKAYSSAASLISYVISSQLSPALLSSAPLLFTRMLFDAATVLWHVLNSSISLSLDRSHGKTLFDAATFVMRHMAATDDDLPMRGARCLNLLWYIGERDSELRNCPPRLHVESRMTANLAFSCLVRIRDFKATSNIGNLNDYYKSSSSVSVWSMSHAKDGMEQCAAQPATQTKSTGCHEHNEADPDGQTEPRVSQSSDTLPDMDWLWSSDSPIFVDF